MDRSSSGRPALTPWGYFLATFGFTWIAWSIPVLIHFGLFPTPASEVLRPASMGFVVLGAFGPMFGALVMSRREGGKGAALQHFRRLFKMKNAPRWYLIPVALLGLVELVAWALSLAWGEAPIASYLPTPWIIPIYLVLMVYLGGGQEEFGWRGYALDRLLGQHNDVVASFILGAVWGLWHLPLWFMTGTPQVFMPFAAFLTMTVSLSVIMTWLYLGSGRSMFIAMWTHGVANALMAIIPVVVLAAVSQYRYWIFCACLALSALVITLARGPNRRTGSSIPWHKATMTRGEPSLTITA
jgi:membrane protease YdiL (CAAX protease family)